LTSTNPSALTLPTIFNPLPMTVPPRLNPNIGSSRLSTPPLKLLIELLQAPPLIAPQ
jgi:hypothetical protein